MTDNFPEFKMLHGKPVTKSTFMGVLKRWTNNDDEDYRNLHTEFNDDWSVIHKFDRELGDKIIKLWRELHEIRAEIRQRIETTYDHRRLYRNE